MKAKVGAACAALHFGGLLPSGRAYYSACHTRNPQRVTAVHAAVTCVRCRGTFQFRLCVHCGKRPDQRYHTSTCPNAVSR